MGHNNQKGAIVPAAQIERMIEIIIASRVETKAICTVSSRPSTVRSIIDQSGGKNWPVKRRRFPM